MSNPFTLSLSKGQRVSTKLSAGHGVRPLMQNSADMLGFWVYMLQCGDGSFYIGQTDDLERRLAQHGSGELGGYTADRHPLKLVFAEEFPTRDEAICRERQLKGWSRRKKEALIAGDWSKVQRLARTARQP